MEQGEGSGSKRSDEIWSKLVPSDSRYSDVELWSDEVEIHSEVKVSSFEKQGWCKITRNSDLSSATLQNKSLNVIFVDGTDVPSEGTIMISCGSEIIPGPASEGYLSYRFKVMPMNESPKKVLKIFLDSEHAKCSICLNIWHDVVTVAPCLHNFCNGCFSEWLRRSQEKHSNVLCPHCRSVVQFVGRNHFLHSIQEEILQSDGSLRRSDEELTVLNSYALIKSPLFIDNGKKPGHKRSRVAMADAAEVQPQNQTGPIRFIQQETVDDSSFHQLEALIAHQLEARIAPMSADIERMASRIAMLEERLRSFNSMLINQ